MTRFRILAAAFLLATLCAVCAPTASAQAAELPKADRILVLKAERRLELLKNGRPFITYPIALGFHPKGTKLRQGDGRTPEGVYVIDGRTAVTPYHLALHIAYPGADDRRRAAAAGVSPGGAIFIHGMPARFGHTDPVRFFRDWTNGCIAVGNIAIEVIWASVADGTPIEIRP
jgi:murein L,D-transpeptidase YafK